MRHVVADEDVPPWGDLGPIGVEPPESLKATPDEFDAKAAGRERRVYLLTGTLPRNRPKGRPTLRTPGRIVALARRPGIGSAGSIPVVR